MELRDALLQISEIRQQMARSATFRGYRSATTALSGVLAIVAAACQRWVVPDPQNDLWTYLTLWIAVAVLGAGTAAAEMIVRGRISASEVQRQLTMMAVEQFLPCLVAGGLLTGAVARFAPSAGWMLPGLWCILFSLGIFASRQVMPAEVFWAGGWYLLAGLVCLVLARGAAAFSPWAMGVSFGAGQAIMAGILYWKLERRDGTQQE